VGSTLLVLGTATGSGELVLAVPFIQVITSAFIERNTGSR
jgi:hypothetical protein